MLHDTKTEGNNLSCEKEVDNLSIVSGIDWFVTRRFNKGTNDAKRREAKVFERSGFRSGIQEGVQQQWEVS